MSSRGASRLVVAIVLLVAVACCIWLGLTGSGRLEAWSQSYEGLRVFVRVERCQVEVGEPLSVEVGLLNLGSRSATIFHGDPLLFVVIYNASTGERLHVQPPFVHFVLIRTTLEPGGLIRRAYNVSFDRPGAYGVGGLASFSVDGDEESLSTDMVVVSAIEASA